MAAIFNLFFKKYLFDDFMKGISPVFLPEAGKVYANGNLNAGCDLIMGMVSTLSEITGRH